MADGGTQPLDFMAAIFKKLDDQSQEFRQINVALTQLTVGTETLTRGMQRIEATVERQQEGINALTLNQHRNDAAIAAVSATVTSDHQMLQAHDRLLPALQDDLGDMQTEQKTLRTDLTAVALAAETHRRRWEPWAEGLKWAALIIGGLLLAAVATWFLRDVAQSVLGG